MLKSKTLIKLIILITTSTKKSLKTILVVIIKKNYNFKNRNATS